jgi:hypothetical protein
MKHSKNIDKWWVMTAILLAITLTGLSGPTGAAAHTYDPTATPTLTPSPTRIPEPQPCQIIDVLFDRDSYRVGDPIAVTVKLRDDLGNLLMGAKVVAEINRQDLAAQAAIGFSPINFTDKSGDYDGLYSQTGLPGKYRFTFTASDPTGTRFLPCSAEGVVTVEGDDGGNGNNGPAVVKVLPELLRTSLCNPGRETSTITVENVAGLAAVELELLYNPAVIQAFDADSTRLGVQVRPGPAFAAAAIDRNEVDTGNGRIYFTARLLGGSLTGAADLLAVDWRPHNVGVSTVTLEKAALLDAGGQPLPVTLQNGSVQVEHVISCTQGVVALQGRADHSGVVVTNGAGHTSVSLPDGSFGLPTTDAIRLQMTGYLPAVADMRPRAQLAQADQAQINLGRVSLLAGDVNGDNVVNVLDLAFVAGNFKSNRPQADLNADGQVNIFDMVLVAGNYQHQGPLAVPWP